MVSPPFFGIFAIFFEFPPLSTHGLRGNTGIWLSLFCTRSRSCRIKLYKYQDFQSTRLFYRHFSSNLYAFWKFPSDRRLRWWNRIILSGQLGYRTPKKRNLYKISEKVSLFLYKIDNVSQPPARFRSKKWIQLLESPNVKLSLQRNCFSYIFLVTPINIPELSKFLWIRRRLREIRLKDLKTLHFIGYRGHLMHTR